MIINKPKVLSKDYTVISINDIKRNLKSGTDYVDDDDDKLHEDNIKSGVDRCEKLIKSPIVPQTLSITIYDFSEEEIVIDESGFKNLQDIIVDGVSGNTGLVDYVVERHTYFKVKLVSTITCNTLELVYDADQMHNHDYKRAIIVCTSDMYDTDSSSYGYQTTDNKTVLRLLNIPV